MNFSLMVDLAVLNLSTYDYIRCLFNQTTALTALLATYRTLYLLLSYKVFFKFPCPNYELSRGWEGMR